MNTAGRRTLVRLLLLAVAIGVVGMHHLGSPMSGDHHMAPVALSSAAPPHAHDSPSPHDPNPLHDIAHQCPFALLVVIVILFVALVGRAPLKIERPILVSHSPRPPPPLGSGRLLLTSVCVFRI